MKNWDLVETRREYLLGMGWTTSELEGRSDEWVFRMTSPLRAL